MSTKTGFGSNGNTPFMYLESASTASVAGGLDSAASDIFKLSVSASPNAVPTTSPQFTIDPSTNGDVTLDPNGSGAINAKASAVTTTGGVVQAAITTGALSSSKGTDGQMLIGSTAGGPSWASITAGTGIGVALGANSTTISASTATPLSFPTDSGTATPSANALTISGAGGITTSGSGSTITITGSGGGFTWNDVTTTSASMAVNNGYSANNAGLVTLTLPGTAAFGSYIEVTSGISGTGLWQIAQPAGVTIHFGNQNTTTGVTGYLQAQNQYDGVRLLCNKADTDWVVLPGTQGNITVN